MPHVHDYSGRTSLDLCHRRDYEGTPPAGTPARGPNTPTAHTRDVKNKTAPARGAFPRRIQMLASLGGGSIPPLPVGYSILNFRRDVNILRFRPPERDT